MRQDPKLPQRFDVSWTPTVLILDPGGVERHRVEGYLPNREFQAQLELGLAKVAFKSGRFDEAEKLYGAVSEHYPGTPAAPEAIYWRAVSRYKRTGDGSALGDVAAELAHNYPGTEWATRSGIWAA